MLRPEWRRLYRNKAHPERFLALPVLDLQRIDEVCAGMVDAVVAMACKQDIVRVQSPSNAEGPDPRDAAGYELAFPHLYFGRFALDLFSIGAAMIDAVRSDKPELQEVADQSRMSAACASEPGHPGASEPHVHSLAQGSLWHAFRMPAVVAFVGMILTMFLRWSPTGWLTMIYGVGVILFGVVYYIRFRHRWRTEHWAKYAVFVCLSIAGVTGAVPGIAGRVDLPGLGWIEITPIAERLAYVALIAAVAFGFLQAVADRRRPT